MPVPDLSMLGEFGNTFQTNYLPVRTISVAPSSSIEQQSEPIAASSVPSKTSDSLVLQHQPKAVVQTINSETNNNLINSNNSKQLNVEEMSLNELKEECRRRKLLVTGNKQKLIDRIKLNMGNSAQPKPTQQQQQQSIIKSPDSGVNMDSSPSFVSSELIFFKCSLFCSKPLINKHYRLGEQSPNNLGLSNMSAHQTGNTKPKLNNQKSFNGESVNKSTSQQQQQQQKQTKSSSSLDDFFNFLDIENLGASNTESTKTKTSNLVDNANSINNNNINVIGSGQTESINKLEPQNKSDNLCETAATLEMSLKNSAELLKQLSSIGQIEHLHQLENQMKESMQLIEKLKHASNKQQTNSIQQHEYTTHETHLFHHNHSSTHNFQANSGGSSKLRPISSMPSNLTLLRKF